MTISIVASDHLYTGSTSGTSSTHPSTPNIEIGDVVLLGYRWWQSDTAANSPTTFSGTGPAASGAAQHLGDFPGSLSAGLHADTYYFAVTSAQAASTWTQILAETEQWREIHFIVVRSTTGSLTFGATYASGSSATGPVSPVNGIAMTGPGIAIGQSIHNDASGNPDGGNTGWTHVDAPGRDRTDMWYRISTAAEPDLTYDPSYPDVNSLHHSKITTFFESAGASPTVSNVQSSVTDDSVTVTADITSTDTPTATATLDGTVDYGPTAMTVSGSAPNFTVSHTFAGVANDTYAVSVTATNGSGSDTGNAAGNAVVNYTPPASEHTIVIRATGSVSGPITDLPVTIQVTT